MRLWRNRLGRTLAEDRRDRGEPQERRWHRVEILIETSDAEFDHFFDALADAAFQNEPEGTDAHVSAQSGVEGQSFQEFLDSSEVDA